jgi:hypothetical protein
LTTKIEVVLNTVLKRIMEPEERERMRRSYGNNWVMRDSVIGTRFHGIEDRGFGARNKYEGQ